MIIRWGKGKVIHLHEKENAKIQISIEMLLLCEFGLNELFTHYDKTFF